MSTGRATDRADCRRAPIRWRSHVLDLVTLAETPLAEARSVDDRHVVYALTDDTLASVTTSGRRPPTEAARGCPKTRASFG